MALLQIISNPDEREEVLRIEPESMNNSKMAIAVVNESINFGTKGKIKIVFANSRSKK